MPKKADELLLMQLAAMELLRNWPNKEFPKLSPPSAVGSVWQGTAESRSFFGGVSLPLATGAPEDSPRRVVN